MEGQEEPLSDTDTTSSTDLELVALDNLQCSQPSSQPSASQPSSQPSASTSTTPPSRLQTYSSKQRRLQVTRMVWAAGLVCDVVMLQELLELFGIVAWIIITSDNVGQA